MILSSDNASFLLPGGSSYIPDSVELLGINQNGPAGVLPPGYHGTITLQFLPNNRGAHVLSHFTLSTIPSAATPFDWNSVKNDLRPPDVPSDAWDAIYQNFTAAVGSTLDQYQQALDNAATCLSQLGERVHGRCQPLPELRAATGRRFRRHQPALHARRLRSRLARPDEHQGRG
jgi:hypothetical protein